MCPTPGSARPAWSGYLAFDHQEGPTSDVDLRLALAHAVDRDAISAILPINMVVATGGIVPPALQGHTPDISLRFDPDLAREALERSGFDGALTVACLDEDEMLVAPVLESWRTILGLDVQVRPWRRSDIATMPPPRQLAPIYLTGWLPGYADPEYFLRLLFQSDSRTNEGGFASEAFDQLIERARQERSDRSRLGALPPGRPHGGGGARGGDPRRLRTQHVAGEAARARLVGVREVIGQLRRPPARPLSYP